MTARRLPRFAAAFALAFTCALAGCWETDADPARQALDRYDQQATDLYKRAHARVAEIRNRAAATGDRFGGEIVGKPLLPGCHQKPHVMGFELSTTLRDQKFADVTTPSAAATYSRAEFDAWLAAYMDYFNQADRWLTQEQANLRSTLEEKRRELDDANKRSSTMGADWVNRQRTAIMNGVGINAAAARAYGAVQGSYEWLLQLGTIEVGNRGAPPGMACVDEAELSTQDLADMVPVNQLTKAAAEASEGGDHATEERLLRQLADATGACALQQDRRRDQAASRLRPALARLVAERESVRASMIAWRRDLVTAKLFDGEGDAAAAAVYGVASNLTMDNIVAAKNTGWTDVYDVYVPRRGGQGPLDLDLTSVPRPWERSLASAPRVTAGEIGFVTVDAWCVQQQSPVGALAAKYPDLEIQQPFVLVANARARVSAEGTASGAAASERP